MKNIFNRLNSKLAHSQGKNLYTLEGGSKEINIRWNADYE